MSGSSSGVDMPPPGGSSGGDDLDAPFTEDTGAACGPSLQSLGPSSTISACWSCVSKGCGMQLYGCSQDCACNAAIGDALQCVDQNGIGSATRCFTSAAGNGDSLTTAFIDCLAMTANECGCRTTETPDTGTSCVMGGSSSGGNAECTSEIDETCGSNFYQVVCSCPANECVCFGDSTKIIPIESCPLCPGLGATAPNVTNLLDLCGFPD